MGEDASELVLIYEEIVDVTEDVDRICNRVFNRAVGFRQVSKRDGRNPTVYQTLTNVQRNLSLAAQAINELLEESAASQEG